MFQQDKTTGPQAKESNQQNPSELIYQAFCHIMIYPLIILTGNSQQVAVAFQVQSVET